MKATEEEQRGDWCQKVGPDLTVHEMRVASQTPVAGDMPECTSLAVTVTRNLANAVVTQSHPRRNKSPVRIKKHNR